MWNLVPRATVGKVTSSNRTLCWRSLGIITGGAIAPHQAPSVIVGHVPSLALLLQRARKVPSPSSKRSDTCAVITQLSPSPLLKLYLVCNSLAALPPESRTCGRDNASNIPLRIAEAQGDSRARKVLPSRVAVTIAWSRGEWCSSARAQV